MTERMAPPSPARKAGPRAKLKSERIQALLHPGRERAVSQVQEPHRGGARPTTSWPRP